MRFLLPAALLLSLAVAPAADAATRLRTAKSCEMVLNAGRDAAVRPAIPFRGGSIWGTGQLSPREALTAPRPRPEPGILVETVAAAPGSAAPTADSSTTNVQEVGIDEPDLMKLVGTTLYAVVGTDLRILDVSGDEPRQLSKLPMGAYGARLLVRGPRLLVLTRKGQPSPIAGDVAISMLPEEDSASLLMEIRVDDPAAPRIVRTMEVPGEIVDARLTGGTARIVVNSAADIGARAGRPITRRAAARLRVRDFVPRTILRSRVTGRTYRRSLVGCREVSTPSSPRGTDLLSVLSVDLDRGLFNVDRDAVLGAAQAVYASDRSLYVVASGAADASREGELPPQPSSEVHRFDTTRAGETDYAASGTVPGFVVNRFALSERRGVLRIATTTGPAWLSTDESESRITTLRQDGSRLKALGRVTGLGKSERIFSVRFVDETAYVVTFRQTDPFYTVDLSDPERPTLLGELKIPGFSTYLHDVGDDLILGVGSLDGAPAVSLFDVRSLRSPKLLVRRTLAPNGYSPVGDDPYAFLFWPDSGVAYVPARSWSEGTGESRASLQALIATRDGRLALAGEVRHGPTFDEADVLRTAVIGDRLITLSDLGLRTSRRSDLAPQGFLAWVQS